MTNLREDGWHQKRFIQTGKFLPGTVFERDPLKNATKGNSRYWKYYCPTCSVDEYVVENLCDGIFYSSMQPLLNGNRTCRCSKQYKWNQKQREYQISKKISSQSLPYTFIKWCSDGYKNHSSKFIYECQTHGLQSVRVNDFLFKGHKCAKCQGKNFNCFYINSVSVDNILVACKFGITSNYAQRLKCLRTANKAGCRVEPLLKWEIKESEDCIKLESLLKKNFTCCQLSDKVMPQGFTETFNTEDLNLILSSIEDYLVKK